MTTTLESAFNLCEAAGFEPRIEQGSLGETIYWVCIDTVYHAFYGTDQFLSWADAYWEYERRDSAPSVPPTTPRER